MAIWKIQQQNGNYIGRCNSAETADEAIARFKAEWPCYTIAANSLRAVRMRSIYVNGGYSVVEA